MQLFLFPFIFILCMYTLTMSEEGADSPGIGLLELCAAGWILGIKPHALQDQQALLITEPSPQPQESAHFS